MWYTLTTTCMLCTSGYTSVFSAEHCGVTVVLLLLSEVPLRVKACKKDKLLVVHVYGAFKQTLYLACTLITKTSFCSDLTCKNRFHALELFKDITHFLN